MYASQQLDHISGPEKCLLSCAHHPQTQKSPAFLCERSLVSVRLFAFWLFPGSLHLLQKCGKGPGAITQEKHQGFILSGQSDCDGILQREHSTSHSGACKASVTGRFHHKLFKELSSSISVNYLSRGTSGFMRASLCSAGVEALNSLLLCITPHKVVSALSVMHLVSMMLASHMVVPLGLLHIRKI